MPRYVVRNASAEDAWWIERPAENNITVYDAEPADTGLVDSQGNRIVRLPDQIGFVRSE